MDNNHIFQATSTRHSVMAATLFPIRKEKKNRYFYILQWSEMADFLARSKATTY